MTDQTTTSDSFADSALVAPESEQRKPREFEILLANVTEDQLFNFRVLWFRANSFTADTIKKSHALYETLRVQYAGMPDIVKTEDREGTKEIAEYKLVCVSLGAEVQDLVYFLAHGSVNRTIHQQLIPNDWKELALLHLGQITIPDTDTDNKKTEPVKAIAPPKKKPDVEVIERKKVAPPPPPSNPEINRNSIDDNPIKPTVDGYEFLRDSPEPYKRWRLFVGSETYHLTMGEKHIVAYLLKLDEPQSKDQIKAFGIAFNIPAMERLKEMGLLHAYSQKVGDKRSVFYGVETDEYRPQYNGYFRKNGIASQSTPSNSDLIDLERPQAAVDLDTSLRGNPDRTNIDPVISRTNSVPYKPWTLEIGDRVYHMANTAGETVRHILSADEPQSKDQLGKAGINFNHVAQASLSEMGVLRLYFKSGIARKVFFAIAAEVENPSYAGFTLKNGNPQKTVDDVVMAMDGNSTEPVTTKAKGDGRYAPTDTYGKITLG